VVWSRRRRCDGRYGQQPGVGKGGKASGNHLESRQGKVKGMATLALGGKTEAPFLPKKGVALRH